MSAIPFIQYEDGRFSITDQAKVWLETLEGDIAAICVAGPYRSGKSFLINSILEKSSGFQGFFFPLLFGQKRG